MLGWRGPSANEMADDSDKGNHSLIKELKHRNLLRSQDNHTRILFNHTNRRIVMAITVPD
jgi:hypothetical protein